MSPSDGDEVYRSNLIIQVVICGLSVFSVTSSPLGCKVWVQPYVVFTEPSYNLVAGEPTLTPNQRFYRGLVEINVQLLSEEHLEVISTFLPVGCGDKSGFK